MKKAGLNRPALKKLAIHYSIIIGVSATCLSRECTLSMYTPAFNDNWPTLKPFTKLPSVAFTLPRSCLRPTGSIRVKVSSVSFSRIVS